MVSSVLEKALYQQLDDLPPRQQRQVLEFARALATSQKASQIRGVSGQQLLRFAGTIEADDLKLMAQAIQDDCEKVESW